jgi:hypothetical protein
MGWVVNATPQPIPPPPGNTRHPLYRRPCGPQERSGWVRKISPPPGFDPRTLKYRVAHLKVAHIRALCSYCERTSQNWRMRKPLSCHWCHYQWVPSVCVHAVLIKMAFCVPNMSQLWNWEGNLKCATLQYAGGQNQQKSGEEMQHNREHINLYCSANVTKQVTHSVGKHSAWNNSVAFYTKKLWFITRNCKKKRRQRQEMEERRNPGKVIRQKVRQNKGADETK